MAEVDAWGRVVLGVEDAFQILYAGGSISDFPLADAAAVERFNAAAEMFDSDTKARGVEEPEVTPEEEHRARAARWLIPERYRSLDIRAHVLSLCKPEEIERCTHELDLYEARGLFPMLRAMVFLVEDLRARDVVYGVGRGSSVASHVLFKIGVHRIDALRYNLDIREFLR
jgi:DNA polymerase III alpha subunit